MARIATLTPTKTKVAKVMQHIAVEKSDIDICTLHIQKTHGDFGFEFAIEVNNFRERKPESLDRDKDERDD